jgi:alkylglycerol monooxygenase
LLICGSNKYQIHKYKEVCMDIMIFAIPVFFLLIGVELLVAKLHRQEAYRVGDAVSNISCGIVQQVIGIFLRVLTLGAYVYLYKTCRIFDIPNTWWSYILLFLLIDLLYYWFHRYSHEISIFWGTHVVHHQSEDYNLSVALRQSAFQVLISNAFYMPLALLGFEPLIFVLLNTIQTLYQFWIHTEAIKKMPAWFEYIFNTPSHHRVHHGRNPKYIDKNHGGTLIIFDRLFGTFQPEEEEVVYGVTKPLNTWSPIWANIDYYKDLANAVQSAPTWGDKLRMLYKNPGWQPDSMGGTPAFEQVQRDTVQKYHTPLPTWVNYYVLLQYVLVLLGTTFFLATAATRPIYAWQTIAMASGVILSVWALSAILDRRAWAWQVEILRLLLLPILVVALILYP